MVEVINKDIMRIERQEMPDQQKRSGLTVVTSVSISKEFKELIDHYNLSPTEVFRKGMAVALHDMGAKGYKTPSNESRARFVKKFMKDLEEDEKAIAIFEKFVVFAEEIIKIKKEMIENETN